MEFAKTQLVTPRFEWRESSGSTNSELRKIAEREDLPHGTVFATHMQLGGRGRMGREWVTPPGTALAISVLLRSDAVQLAGVGGSVATAPDQPLGMSWVPLLAGSALARALQPYFGDGMRVGVKWPNDVHVRSEDEAAEGDIGKKLCGVLCEVLGDGSIIVGAGVNVLVPEWELPTERATSLLVAGGNVGGAESTLDPLGQLLADELMAAFVQNLLTLVADAGEQPQRARTTVLRHSLTLGSEVRVHFPGGKIVDGRATGLDGDGALIVDLPTGGSLTVNAGDVEHLR